jgi:hypothetical protein
MYALIVIFGIMGFLDGLIKLQSSNNISHSKNLWDFLFPN